MMNRITRIYLVRHGATTLTAEDRFAGATDVELSDVGRRQAEALSRRLSQVPLAAVYASPLKRTQATARIIAKPHRLGLQLRDGLREISHGHWEGLTRQEVVHEFPAEMSSWDQDPFTFAPAGGESGLAVVARALPDFMQICADHVGEQIALISHKATIRLLLSSLLGFDPRRYRDNLDQSPCALNIIDSKGPTCFRLALFNDTSHYAVEPADLPPVADARLSARWSRDG
jgi:broad specificity phosphatase PhoE